MAPMHLSVVSLAGDQVAELTAEPTDFIHIVRARLGKKIGIPPWRLRLVHRDAALAYGHSLERAAVEDGAVLTMLTLALPTVATASKDTTVRIWDAASGSSSRVLEGHDAEVSSVAFSADGHLVITASADGTARVWTVATGEPMATLRGHGAAVLSAAFSPDGGARALTASRDGTARLWSWASGDCLAVFQEEEPSVVSLAVFSPDGTKVLTSGGPATTWATDSGERVRCYAQAVLTARFSEAGEWVTGACNDGAVRVWNADTGECAWEMWVSPVGKPADVVFAPDPSSLLVACQSEAQLLHWTLETGICAVIYEGHRGNVRSVAFSSDGAWVLTASADDTARLWVAASGECVQVFEGHVLGVLGGALWLGS